jgi:hypothetical protein
MGNIFSLSREYQQYEFPMHDIFWQQCGSATRSAKSTALRQLSDRGIHNAMLALLKKLI